MNNYIGMSGSRESKPRTNYPFPTHTKIRR